MNEEGRLLPSGEVGQIIVRSDKIFEGYWRDPESTKKVLKNGWLFTGDLGYFDEPGYLYIVDRLSDMIISGGENVYPREVEKVLSKRVVICEGPPKNYMDKTQKFNLRKRAQKLKQNTPTVNDC